jgi:RHS repeat-associated protein
LKLGLLYDADNNRTRVNHPDTQAFSYTYDARDRLTGVYEGIGTGTALDGIIYNPDDTLATRLEGAGGGGSANYSYDPIGRLTGQTDAFPAAPASNVQWNFQINQASQILSETRDNDAYAFTAIASANKTYAVNGLNQYTAVAGTGHTYDANGNLTGDWTNAYIYDGENRLVSATAAGITTTLTYDPLGRLWQMVKGAANTRYLYDGDALVGEYDGTGALTNRYVHGSNLAADDPLLWYVGAGTATKRYLHADHLGSIVAATNTSSAPSINAYDEYGVPKSGNVGRFQYTGQIWLGELGLYHYKARLYSPTLGRFLQVDRIGYEGGINLYAYVDDDPVNTTDLDGQCPVGVHSMGAQGSGNTTLIYCADGSVERRTGGSLAWRNNNPGNLIYNNNTRKWAAQGAYTRRGRDPLAIFGSRISGELALKRNLLTEKYQSKNVNDAIAAYAPPNENNTAAYQSFVQQQVGVSGDTPLSSLNSQQLGGVIGAIERMEGWKPGSVTYERNPNGSITFQRTDIVTGSRIPQVVNRCTTKEDGSCQ